MAATPGAAIAQKCALDDVIDVTVATIFCQITYEYIFALNLNMVHTGICTQHGGSREYNFGTTRPRMHYIYTQAFLCTSFIKYSWSIIIKN